jgi:ubiquinone/menaquinone biosynthesis C-methylase UbiE
LCAETGLDDVEFVQSAFRELTDVLDERFDVLIVNNSINFLTSRKAYTEAIREFYEILEPGGAMIILTPNRYHLEEAFTGLKGVQFLPDRIADWYVRKKGIRDGYDDIRLPSSFELVWWLRRTGFEDVQVVDAYQFTTEGWRRHFKPRFYVTARKPE